MKKLFRCDAVTADEINVLNATIVDTANGILIQSSSKRFEYGNERSVKHGAADMRAQIK